MDTQAPTYGYSQDPSTRLVSCQRFLLRNHLLTFAVTSLVTSLFYGPIFLPTSAFKQRYDSVVHCGTCNEKDTVLVLGDQLSII